MKYEKRIEAFQNNFVHPSEYEKAVKDYDSAIMANKDLCKQLLHKETELQENKDSNSSIIQELKRELIQSANRVQQIETDFEVKLNKIKIDVNSRAHLSWISKGICNFIHCCRLKWKWT